MESSSVIAQLSGALSAIKQLQFTHYSAPEVTKAMILIEMAIHYLEVSKKDEISAKKPEF